MRKKKVDEVFSVHYFDARRLDSLLNEEIVDVTITSPPYFDLKDYGYKKQIGFGQSYQSYLEDLSIVFKNVYNCTKVTGTLWVIIDSFRRDGEVVPLPFDFSNKIREIGWKLKDVIVWKKDRTVPWVHKGQMRNLFEYILVFSKSDDYHFYIDEVRDSKVLKKWWVRYPERYNPKGKTPTGLWEFDIPTQGSWGDGYIKHFCPLPEEMIEQILKLTSKEGDVVLDPFAGSGAVLAKAENMNRKYIGFELNKSYIQMFKNYIAETGVSKKEQYLSDCLNSLSHDQFELLNLNLRALKFCRVLYSKLSEKHKKIIMFFSVKPLKESPSQKNARIVVEYKILLNSNDYDCQELITCITNIISTPPLSKFGVQPKFDTIMDLDAFVSSFKNCSTIYTYNTKSTHKYISAIKHSEIEKLNRTTEKILSKIKVDLNERDYHN
jgi:DNA modification methylase